MKMISTTPKSLLEVWEWKEEIYNDIKDKSFKEKKKYFKKALEKAVGVLNSKLVKSEDDNYFIISK